MHQSRSFCFASATVRNQDQAGAIDHKAELLEFGRKRNVENARLAMASAIETARSAHASETRGINFAISCNLARAASRP